VIETGARTEAGLSIGVALELLAWNAEESGSDQKRSDILELREKLRNAVSSSPVIAVRQRAEDVGNWIGAILKI
jgi:hypothetical protein